MAKTNMLAIIGLICAFVFPLAGLIISIIALIQINKNPEQGGKGLAIAGIVVSLIFSIISTLLLIAFIAYFGVLDPNSMLPPRCTLPNGLSCTDSAVTKTDGERIMLHVVNGMGTGIIMTGATATPSEGSTIKNACTASFTDTFGGFSNILRLQNGEVSNIMLSCPPGTFSKTKADTMYMWDLKIDQFNDDSSQEYSRPLLGELWAKIE